jgi:hypothetical protein
MRFRSSGLHVAATLPVAFQAVEELCVGRCGRRGLVHDDKVKTGELLLVAAKGFTNDSFDAIPSRRGPAVLLGYRHAEPGGIRCIFSTKHGEKRVATPTCLLKHPPEVGRIEKPVLFTEPVGR